MCLGDFTHFPTEIFNSLKLSGLIPHKLELKIVFRAIYIRNIDLPCLCNKLYYNFIVAMFNVSEHRADIVLIPRIVFILSVEDNSSIRRVQFTVCFYNAVFSINKNY